MLNINNETFYKNFPAFHLTQEINELVKPLFHSTHANYFDYNRIYEDNSFLSLSSNGLWLEHFFKKRYKLGTSVKESGRHLWDSYYYNIATHDARANFNIAHGITIFYKRSDYIEYIDIAAPASNHHITSIYLNQFELIENFIAEFIEKSQPLIKQAESQLVSIPEDMRQASHNELPIRTEIKKYQLSSREHQCLELCLKGLTAKEIASNIKLSPRTVEEYLNNIKRKLGCKNRRELLKLLKYP